MISVWVLVPFRVREDLLLLLFGVIFLRVLCNRRWGGGLGMAVCEEHPSGSQMERVTFSNHHLRGVFLERPTSTSTILCESRDRSFSLTNTFNRSAVSTSGRS